MNFDTDTAIQYGYFDIINVKNIKHQHRYKYLYKIQIENQNIYMCIVIEQVIAL
jgi:cytidylate kinase